MTFALVSPALFSGIFVQNFLPSVFQIYYNKYRPFVCTKSTQHYNQHFKHLYSENSLKRIHP